MKKHDYRLAVLKDRNRDLTKRWFVEFYAFNEDTGKLQRYPIYLPAKYKTDTERRKYAKELIHEINAKLTQGFLINAAAKPDNQKVETKETIQQKTLLITCFCDAVTVLKVARKAYCIDLCLSFGLCCFAKIFIFKRTIFSAQLVVHHDW